jgi:prepilin-type N-terminal cleavage/methylation domain-containing protein
MINRYRHKNNGFTVVELLIVIVIISILSVVVIVAYNGIQHNAFVSVVKTNLKQANTQLGVSLVNNGAYPEALSELNNGSGLKFNNEDATFYYSPYNDLSPKDYCLTAVINGEAFMVTRFTAPDEGHCDDQAPESPTLNANADSTSQISVSWDEIDDAISYTLEYSEDQDFTDSTIIDNITVTTQAITGLSDNTTYYFRVYATNDITDGEVSDTVSQTTLAFAPEGAPSITATTGSSTSISVNWASVDNAASYTLDYSTASNFVAATTITDITGVTYTVNSLAQGMKYYFRLYAVSEGGSSAASNTANATTTISAPDSPSVSVSIPGSARAWNSGVWSKNYHGEPSSGTWYYAQASVSSSTCPSGTTRQWRARVQYNSPTTWGSYSSWSTSTYRYAVQPSSGYGIRFQAQTRCYTSFATSSSSSSGYGCRWKSNNSTSCSGF